eukprot:TRINITY_DN10846_c0_g1_i1.p1 TRINITY_DN10846_c0_g1~~TRINITY_DN10846_c0_g1_i1.p1  ORF type:complete len:444 (+),score=87.91 TRINITY_DN10846_c0_g1_i1:285-1616(+)
MGKRNNQRKSAAAVLFDSDEDTLSTCSTSLSDTPLAQETEEVHDGQYLLDKHLDALYEKRGSTREKALAGLVDAFASHVQLSFVDNKCITLLHQFINSIKRGSTTEVSLASRAIGLLAITVGFGDDAHEIMEESIPPLSLALKSGSDSQKKSSVLDCLAIVTFVGGNNFEETEKSMQIMWQLIHPKSGSNVAVTNKPTSAVLAAALSAWAFLLTTIYELNNSNDWQESISFLSTLLDKDDRSVRIAAGEAIALIFEIGNLKKFSREVKRGTDDSSAFEGNNPQDGFAYVEALKGKILNQVRNLSMEAGGKGSAKKDLNSQRNLFRDVLTFLETGQVPETSTKVQHGGDLLKSSTWTQLIQLNFLKHFLGGGFLKHMQENEFLHDVFQFTPTKKQQLSSGEKRLFKSPNSGASKARTQYLNKQRVLAQGRNHGHFAVDPTDEEA